MNLSVTDKIKKEILARRLMQLRLKYNHLNLFKMLWNVRKLIYKFKMSRWTTNFIEWKPSFLRWEVKLRWKICALKRSKKRWLSYYVRERMLKRAVLQLSQKTIFLWHRTKRSNVTNQNYPMLCSSKKMPTWKTRLKNCDKTQVPVVSEKALDAVLGQVTKFKQIIP